MTAVVDHSVILPLHFKLLVKDEPNPAITELLANKRKFERVTDTMADIQDVVCPETFLPVFWMSSFEVIL